jgi:parallel beta-helix repeat protein
LKGQPNTAQQDNIRVTNLNTGKNYSAIQEAIGAPETLDGHEIFVASGIYYEHLTVNKSLSLIGEDRNTTVIDGNGTGIILYVTADNVHISNFTVQNGQYGIRLYHSKNSRLDRTNVYNSEWFGVEINHSGNCTLRNNSLVGNMYNFGVDGAALPDFVNDIDDSNFVNGKSIYYFVNKRDFEIDSSTFQQIGYLGLVNSTAISVKNLDLKDNRDGILLAYVTNSSIKNVNVTGNWNGIYVEFSSNVSIKGNNASDNFDYAIALRASTNCTVAGNNVNNNGWGGISLGASWNCTVAGNNVNNNYYDIHLVESGNNLVRGNNALLKQGGYSIVVYRSGNNIIYHNTFVTSLLYGETENETYFLPRNSWDNGLEGNYWSLYRGVDTDQDGIGDTPYEVGENNVDNYPLMGEFSDFTVTLGEKNYSITIISSSTPSQFSFNPDDERISFMAAEENGTLGFLRITVPNTLLQNLHGDNLSILINGEQPILKRKWTDEIFTYLYFSDVSSVSKSALSPWRIVAMASALIIFVLIFLFLKKKAG